MGIYNPRIGMANGWDFPREGGPVGGNLQSGGISRDLVRAGALRGLRFSKVVSYGNALDLNESDFQERSRQRILKRICRYFRPG